MNIQITKDAIEYMSDMCGVDKEEAEEHLTIAISMCHFSESGASGAGELLAAVDEILEFLETNTVVKNKSFAETKARLRAARNSIHLPAEGDGQK